MKPNVKVLLLLVCTTVILAVYAVSGLESNSDFAPKHLDISSLQQAEKGESGINAANAKSEVQIVERKKMEPDTTAQKILFFGDSMLEGLCRRFIDYTEENGHQLNTVIWYSSSTELWAKTDTLQYFMRKFEPTYVVVCLGSNELFVKDLPNRKKYVEQIVSKLADIPFVWISPPNWKEDTGINKIIMETVGKDRYFDSTHLTLERGSDHAHPTFTAAVGWMDLVAKWMQSDSVRNPIIMKTPTKDLPPRNVTTLMPYKQ